MKFSVRVLPKDQVLDTQGRAVEEMLQTRKVPIKNLKLGKYMEFDFDHQDEKQALVEIKAICESVLHNPLIEKYQIERMS